MEVSSLSLQLYGHYVGRQFQHPLPCKVALHNPNWMFYGRKYSSIYCNFQKTFTLFNSSDNPYQKSNDTHVFLSNKPVVDVSSVYRMIKEYTDNGLFEEAIQVYINLLERGFPIEEFQFFPCLIKAFGGLSEVNKAKEIHGHLLKLGSLEDIYVQNSLLGMYWKCGDVQDAITMFGKMGERDLVSWNTMISGFCHSEDYLTSLMSFRMMIKEGGVYPKQVACLSALSSCASLEFLNHGQEIHGFAVKIGLDSNEFLVSGLIEMYMKCRDVKNAEHVFDGILDKGFLRGNVVLWNVMILGYVSNECLSHALELFVHMMELGIRPDSSTAVAILVLCTQLLDLAVGKQIHGTIVGFGLENDVRVETALLEMYFKCGDPETGLKVFKRSPNRNLIMWGSVISNCTQGGYPNEALQLFHDYMLDCSFPDSVILLAALRASSCLGLKPKGMEIHGLAMKLGLDSDGFIGGALVDLYGKCGDIKSAQEVFRRLPSRDLVLWNALISGCSQNERADEALEAFRYMLSEQIKPNAVTVACMLSVCTHLSVMIICKELHCYILRHCFDTNILVANSLISTYAKCGDINSSWIVFERLHAKNEVSWNSMILALGMHGHTDEMFAIFEKMKKACLTPDHATFTALLSACSHAGRVEMGRTYLNSMVEDYNLAPRIEQYTCMVDLLGRAGHLNEAHNLIMTMPCSPDARIWGSLLGSCKSHGDSKLAEVVANHIFELDPTSIGYRVLLANLYEDSRRWSEVTQVRSEIKFMGLKKQPGCSWIEVNNKIHIFTAGDSSHYQYEEIYATIAYLTLDMKRMGYIPQLQLSSTWSDEAKEENSLT